MNAISAIYVKQSKDMFKNIGVLAMFVVFPVIAFLLNLLTYDIPHIDEGMFAPMKIAFFIGMGVIMSVASIISEDREANSLRFLVIAGVKPIAYILGIGGVVFTFSILSSVGFGFVGGLYLAQFAPFMAIVLSGCIAGILLGAIIGITAKNVQAASGLCMPIGMGLGLLPFAASFNDNIARFTAFLFTQQVSMFLEDPTVNIFKPMLLIWANIVILLIVFAIVYVKKGRPQ